MMTLREALLLPACLVWSLSAGQSTADDYFNQAAKEYVKADRLTALRTLDKGLREFPQDPKLRKLAEELLKNEQQKQQQQQQQQQEQQKQEQQQQEQQRNEQQQTEQEQASQQENAQEKEEREREQRAEDSDRNDDGKRKPEGMSQRDAERMLDALERREQDVQEQVRAKLRPARRVRIEKDW